MNSEQVLPIYILTLEGADERRAPLLKQLEVLGLEYELFFGVDGRQGLPAQYEQLIDRSARVDTHLRPMTDGEYACALSHLFCYRQIVERGVPQAIILEDDALVGTAFAALAQGQISAPGDLVMLDHDRGFYRWRNKISVAQGLHAYPIAVTPVLATAYVLSRVGAEYFLAHAFPVCKVADWPADITQIDSFAIHPRIADHPDPAMASSHLTEARYSQRQDHKATRVKGWKRWISKAFWLRRQREWYGFWYRNLDATLRLDAKSPPSSSQEGPE